MKSVELKTNLKPSILPKCGREGRKDKSVRRDGGVGGGRRVKVSIYYVQLSI